MQKRMRRVREETQKEREEEIKIVKFFQIHEIYLSMFMEMDSKVLPK